MISSTKLFQVITSTVLSVIASESLIIQSGFSQSATFLTDPYTSTSGNNNNPSQQFNPSNAQNRINFQYPMQTPVNTENDFGFNLTTGINTLDSSDTTIYLGVIFQPGRTNDHKMRMARLRKETELMEAQKQVTQGQLQLLQKQIAEAEIRLQNLQKASESPTP